MFQLFRKTFLDVESSDWGREKKRGDGSGEERKGRGVGKGKWQGEIEWSCICWFTSKISAIGWVRPKKARNMKFLLDLQCECRGPNTWAIFHYFSQALVRKLDGKLSSGTCVWEAGIISHSFMLCTTIQVPVFLHFAIETYPIFSLGLAVNFITNYLDKDFKVLFIIRTILL